MSRSAKRRWLIVFLTSLMCWYGIQEASAQVQASVYSSQPITDQFPTITLYLSVSDSTGRRIPGLPPSSFSVIEDGRSIGDVEVEEVLVGTRQVFAINTSSRMKLRDSLGRTRFDHVRSALLRYWQDPQASQFGIDDLNLITADGALVAHSQSAAELASALDFAEPTFGDSGSGFELLQQALETSADPIPRLGMPKTLIFITPRVQTTSDLQLVNAIARAKETSTIIYAVLVAPAETSSESESETLRQLAQETGGEFVSFDPEKGLSFLKSHLLGQRLQYRLSYTSLANTSGTHRLEIRVDAEDLEASSAPLPFNVAVQPPEVAFIQPPAAIERTSDDPSIALEALPPTSTALRVLINFPDGHPRPILRSQLSADGVIVDERREAPFDTFEWDLSGYIESGTHTLRVEVEDTLGTRGVSLDVPISVTVSPRRGLAALRPALGSLLAVIAVLAAGVVLAVGLLSLGRQHHTPSRPPRERLPTRRRPLQHVRLRRRPADIIEAYLVLDPPSGEPIPLTGGDMLLGKDASLAAIPLDDPSVSDLHARLIRQAGGDYLLRDQGSVAGTWVNYEPVPEEGHRLRHGDLIHLGRVTLRFRLPGAQAESTIQVYPAEGTEAERDGPSEDANEAT